MEELGPYLRRLRGNMSLRYVQKSTGISHTYLSTLEKGYDPRTKKERKPTPEVLKKLARFYDLPYHRFLEVAGYIDESQLEEKRSAEHFEKVKEEIQKMISGDFQKTDGWGTPTDLSNVLNQNGNITYRSKNLSNVERRKIIEYIERNIMTKDDGNTTI